MHTKISFECQAIKLRLSSGPHKKIRNLDYLGIQPHHGINRRYGSNVASSRDIPNSRDFLLLRGRSGISGIFKKLRDFFISLAYFDCWAGLEAKKT